MLGIGNHMKWMLCYYKIYLETGLNCRTVGPDSFCIGVVVMVVIKLWLTFLWNDVHICADFEIFTLAGWLFSQKLLNYASFCVHFLSFLHMKWPSAFKESKNMVLVLLGKYDDLSFICVTLFFLSLIIDQFNCLIKEWTCFFSNSNVVVAMTLTSL